ncbi:M-phase inducer phosphatase [Madurella mycetomatis]|uniref:M-phase inducer phosphatase n=1 Tax=Madurella mycetomatis TaxID=100816 RepID=A0A175WAM4_9PEZI|nr:M-phase inducer phosphatase [Madurella mycetomatis]
METSSPLAAMRPAPPGNLFGPHLVPSPLGPNQFGFQRPNPEYFNVKAVRGSSPAASLAADLSQNFKLNDASSPMFPTPRRALFTTATMMDAFETRDYVTTPPLPPSSSPGHADMMDVSPLPHKAPFVSHVEIQSPTPSLAMADDIMLESPIPRSSMEPSKHGAAERRRLGLRRPSLTRAKGYASGGMVTRSSGNMGDCQLGSSPSSSMSLSECFEDSPPQERRPQSANSPCSMAAARPKSHFNSLNGTSGVRNGSPIVSHTRRTSNPFLRPRKQYRRCLSMFDSPSDVAKARKEEPALQSVMDLEEPHDPILPHFFPEDQNDSIPRITRSTMLDVLDGKYSEHYAHKMIVDCRFEYEYEGGHIDGAINYNDKELLASHLFRTPIEGRTLLIFHCEYSAHRAPIMARYIRAEDRNMNAEHYPRLTYPEVYILDGGYSAFFNEHRERCYPQAYVEMNAAEHVNTCEREMGRLRQNRRGLGRAQTFAFGQQDPTVQDSPTGPARSNSRLCDISMLGASPILGSDRAHARRMASY